MAKKILTPLCFVLFFLLSGCVEVTQEPSPTPTVQYIYDDDVGPTYLEGIVSFNNTSVKLYFNNPVSESTSEASLYKILRPQLCDSEVWNAQLTVTKAELSPDAMVVTLTTAPQTGISYQLIFSGMLDRWGFPVGLAGDSASQVSFTGTAASQAADTDQDGISDADEQYGWTVRTAADADNTSCRDVNSDPSIADTDGDGVTDNFELGYATDPRSADSDRDNLGDYAEIYEYFSSPLQSDTDQDGLLDGVEAQLGLSPALSDTDGDGMSDFSEISSGGTDARLADLPELKLDLYGNPSIILNMSYQKGEKTTKVETTLDQDREEQVNTDNSSTKMSIENTVSLHTEVEASTEAGGWPPSASAKLTTDTEFKHGYFRETSSNWTKSSVSESQDKFESTVEDKTDINFDDGMLWVAMKITNHSDLTFKVKDLRVIAYRMLPNGSFSVVGTLTPGLKSSDTGSGKDTWIQESLCADPADAASCGHVLGPGGEVVLVMGADSLPAQEMKALVSNPSALMFEISSYSLFQLDEWGVKETVNYARLGESVIQRTGILVIDYGDGTVERFMLSSNTLRNPDGSGKGMLLKDALKLAGTADFELCKDGKTLCRIKHAAAFRCDSEILPEQIPEAFCPAATRPQNQLASTSEITLTQTISPSIPLGFWMVAGSGPEFDPGESLDFNTLTLTNGERISLVYMLDSDGDSIFDREEYLLGTDKNNTDSDNDGLSDYQESKEGWAVKVQGRPAYQVYPDPRFQDFDGDFLTDLTESFMRTDPRVKDTDGDDLLDSIDPFPTTPPCMDPASLSMITWWNASNQAQDAATGEPQPGIRSDGTLRATVTPLNWKNVASDKVFSFNLNNITTAKQANQYITVADSPFLTSREFSVSAWVLWGGAFADTDQATILTKGPLGSATFSISILKDGKLKFSIFRNMHIKKWYCWFGAACDDDAAADEDRTELVELVTAQSVVPPPKPGTPSVWTNVVVTFGGETMRIYVNGAQAAEKSTTATWGGSAWDYKNQTSTNSLVANADPLLIGLDKISEPAKPFKGVLDDIQFYTLMLGREEVSLLYSLGVCTP